MKKIILFFALMTFSLNAQRDSYQIELARSFGKAIFETNGIPYLKPLVESVNATSNSRFFQTAYIPKKVEKPYFRVSLNGMTGIIRDDQKTFTPTVPMEPFSLVEMNKYIELDFSNPLQPKVKSIPDTAALILFAFKNILYDGVNKGSIKVPPKASTVFGNLVAHLVLNRDTMRALVKEHPVYPFLPSGFRDTLLKTFDNMPEFYTLSQGGNLSYLSAGIPQLEIGSLWGTELLIRFIPPVNLGEYVGDFAFWGVGLKHSISQYFPERYFDVSIQAVYQGTNLRNKFGVTNSELTANANIWNLNLQISKSFEEYKTSFIQYFPDIYLSLSTEYLNISSSVKYYMSVETQAQLGLLPVDYNERGEMIKIYPPDPANGYPGDTKPNISNISLEDNNIKLCIGLRKEFKNFSIFGDYNFSKFNILTAGLSYTF